MSDRLREEYERSQLELERAHWVAQREREDRERARAIALRRSRGPYQRTVSDDDEYNDARAALDLARARWFEARNSDRERRTREAEKRGETLVESSVLLSWAGCALCGSVVPCALPSRRALPHACLYLAGSDQ